VFSVLSLLKRYVQSERGDAVVWVVLIIIGVIIAVTVWKYLGGGVKNAARAMGNALSGQ
jgi:hypothetical protein